jgi:hypothetical protein
MFDPKRQSKLLKVHNSRDVIACSNSNLIIGYFHLEPYPISTSPFDLPMWCNNWRSLWNQ